MNELSREDERLLRGLCSDAQRVQNELEHMAVRARLCGGTEAVGEVRQAQASMNTLYSLLNAKLAKGAG